MTTVNRDQIERRVFGVLRPVFIVFLLVITLFPFYYMVMLSFRPLDAVLQDPGALFRSSARSTSAPTRTCWHRSRTAARAS